jgi:hypothetical protein
VPCARRLTAKRRPQDDRHETEQWEKRNEQCQQCTSPPRNGGRKFGLYTRRFDLIRSHLRQFGGTDDNFIQDSVPFLRPLNTHDLGQMDAMKFIYSDIAETASMPELPCVLAKTREKSLSSATFREKHAS